MKPEFKNEFYANEKRIAEREYHNAIGDDFDNADDDADGAEMSADEMEADALGDDFNADAATHHHRGAAQKSLPFILTLTNQSTSTTVTSIPIFYANKYVYAANTGSNIMPCTGGSVLFSVSNYDSYAAFLQQTMQKPFHVGKTYWVSGTTGVVSSVNFLVTYNSADGRTAGFPLIPIIDKYAYNANVNDSATPYVIDGNTLLTLNLALVGSATIQIQFYAASTVSLKKQLSKGTAKSVYANPYKMGLNAGK